MSRAQLVRCRQWPPSPKGFSADDLAFRESNGAIIGAKIAPTHKQHDRGKTKVIGRSRKPVKDRPAISRAPSRGQRLLLNAPERLASLSCRTIRVVFSWLRGPYYLPLLSVTPRKRVQEVDPAAALGSRFPRGSNCEEHEITLAHWLIPAGKHARVESRLQADRPLDGGVGGGALRPGQCENRGLEGSKRSRAYPSVGRVTALSPASDVRIRTKRSVILARMVMRPAALCLPVTRPILPPW